MKKSYLVLIPLIFNLIYSQSVEIKDSSDETLMIVNDEGTDKSSITIPSSPSAPTSATNKLYNEGGTLKWSGNTLTTGSSLWTLSSGNVYRSTGNVGIGTANPLSKLSVGGNGSTSYTIYGETVNNSGVVGNATGNGHGVSGFSSGTGVSGVSGSVSGSMSKGVWGLASNSGDVENYGGFFEAYGTNGYGLYGQSSGSSGHGIFGWAAHDSGVNYAVHGKTESPNGWAGYFEGRGYFDGNVGIGTTNPQSQLSVGGNGESFAMIYSETAEIDGIGVYGNATYSGTAYNKGGHFAAYGTNGRGVWAVSGGNSGIGVYAQAMGASATGVVGEGGAFDFNANGPGVDYGATSSIRWKRNIVGIDNPLEKLSELRGVYFDWDEKHGGHHDIGCIAEEVGKVLPEIVVYEENGIDASGMDYSKLTPLLVEAVKELSREVDRLKQLLGE